MSQNLPKRSLGDVLSLRHPNHFVLAGANNRNVIITYRFLAAPVQENRDFFYIDCMTVGAFHLVKISGISGSAVNGTRFVGSSHWKIPRKSGRSKQVVPFSRLEFPNGMSCSIYVSCSLYQFQVHGRAAGHVPWFTTKWNNFLPIGNSTFATTEISGFFRKWKAPCVSRFAVCDRNYDWRQRKTQLWRRLLNFRVRMFVKSAVRSGQLGTQLKQLQK